MGSLIIIRGPLGIGKTTIAKNLAKLLKARYFSVDEILSKNNLDYINEEIGCIPENNFLKVNKIIFSKIKSSNKSIIVDGNFYYQNQIKDLINKIPLKSFAFTLIAPIEVCILRDSQRSNSYGQAAVVAVYNLVSRFDYGQIINTSSLTIEETIKTILSKIDN
jgi:tRNA uridine 5-carbamoylmethylation protein Kti12